MSSELYNVTRKEYDAKREKDNHSAAAMGCEIVDYDKYCTSKRRNFWYAYFLILVIIIASIAVGFIMGLTTMLRYALSAQ